MVDLPSPFKRGVPLNLVEPQRRHQVEVGVRLLRREGGCLEPRVLLRREDGFLEPRGLLRSSPPW